VSDSCLQYRDAVFYSALSLSKPQVYKRKRQKSTAAPGTQAVFDRWIVSSDLPQYSCNKRTWSVPRRSSQCANQVSATNLECLGPCGISMWRSVAQSMAVQWRPIKNHSTTECQTPCQVIVSLRSLESLRATLHYEANLAIRFRHHVQSWTLYQDAYRVGLIAHPFAINSSFLIMWPEVWWCVSEALP